MSHLLATAPTKQSLLQSIEKFYCGTKMMITDNNQVQRVSDGKILESVIVKQKGKRWRFEAA